MLLWGLENHEPSIINHHFSLTSDLLSHCIETIRSGYPFHSVNLILASIFLLAYFSFLRSPEFAPSSSRYDPSIQPCLSDITILNKNTFIFTLRKSKSDQLGTSFPIQLFRSSFIPQPLRISNYIQSRLASNASPLNPLFINESGSLATRFWFSYHFRHILFLSGITPEQYSIHSIRIDAANISFFQVCLGTEQVWGKYTNSRRLHPHAKSASQAFISVSSQTLHRFTLFLQ